MLRIIPSKSAAAAKSYYTSGLSRQDYYQEGQEIEGRWHGKLANILRLPELVNQKDFNALCDNEHPTKGGTLTQRTDVNRRVGYDFTFIANKYAAIALHLNGDTRVLGAHHKAVAEVMRLVQQDAMTRVRGKGRDFDRHTGNLLWADFTHFTTRPVNGVPDLDLHTHVFVFNATHDPVEDKIKAAQFGDLKRDAPYYEAIYESLMAKAIQELGYQTERDGNTYRIVGISKEMVDKFSNRTKVINAKAAAKKITDAKILENLGAETREYKRKDQTLNDLMELWQGRLTPVEWKALDSLRGRKATPEELTPTQALQYAVAHEFDKVSVIPERTLIRTALQRSFGKLGLHDIEAAILRSDLIDRTVKGRKLVSTKQVLALESAILSFARYGRGQLRPLVRRVERAKGLNAAQRAVVTQLLTSKDRVNILHGGAGVGKTFALQEVARQIQQSGKQAFVFTPGSGFVNTLRKDFGNGDTVAQLFINSTLQEQIAGQVIIVDEAGQLSLKDMAQLFGISERLNCRLILAGDTKQHGSVQAGDALRILEDFAGLKPASLKEITRQRGDYKKAVKAIAKGKIEEGYQILDSLGWVQELPEGDERYHMAANAYLEARTKGKTAMVVSPTHAEEKRITDEIRGILRHRGQIGDTDTEITTLRNLYWSPAYKADAMKYRAGMVVQAFENAPGIRRGDRLEVLGRAGAEAIATNNRTGETVFLPLDSPERFQVYERESKGFAVGDAIRHTAGGKSVEGNKLANGRLDTIARISATRLYFTSGLSVNRDFGHLTHGYCSTSWGSQGKTVDEVFIIQAAESFPASNREQWYVSVSRGKVRAIIFTDNKAALLDAIQRSGIRASATELVKGRVSERAKPLRIPLHILRNWQKHYDNAMERESYGLER